MTTRVYADSPEVVNSGLHFGADRGKILRMGSATVADVVRPLTPTQRARLRRALETETRASERVTEVLRQLVAEGAPVISLAAEMHMTRQGVYKRLRKREAQR